MKWFARKELNKRRANKKKQKINAFFICDKLDSPSVVENTASAMHDVSREESDLFQEDVCKGKI